MPRKYKPKLGGKTYKKHTTEDIKKAILAVSRGMSYGKAAEEFGIPQTVIFRHRKKTQTLSHGGQTALDMAFEELCEENDIRFAFHPPNFTHLCQPLDVSFFRRLKMAWRPILTKWKQGAGKRESTIPKDTFPRLLNELLTAIEPNCVQNIISGFSKCGIVSFSPNKVLDRLPQESGIDDPKLSPCSESDTGALDDTIVSYLKDMRYNKGQDKRKRKKKVNVSPGKSVGASDLERDLEEDLEENLEEDDNEITREDSMSESSDGLDEYNGNDEENMNASDDPLSLSGITPITDGIMTGTWVLVNFSAPGKNMASRPQRKLYLVRVENIIGNNEYEGGFLRKSHKSNGSTFVFPEREDSCLFTSAQIVGQTPNPQEQRRGILKFQVNSKEW